MTKKLISAVLVLVLGISLFTGCGSKVDEFVTVDNVNQSSVNVAEGFFQAIFTYDIELFEACYPASFKDYENEDGDRVDLGEVLFNYSTVLDPSYSYIGASVSAYNDYSEEYGYTDFPELAQQIADVHHTTVDLIPQIQIVKLRLNFSDGSGNTMTTDVYVLVYKSEGAWYVYELQNSDAEFAV